MKAKIFVLCIGCIILAVFYLSLNIIESRNTQNKSLKNQVVNSNLIAKDTLQIEDFQIGGIKLDYKIQDVIKVMGNPLKKYKGEKDITEYYEYPGLKIEYGVKTKDILSILVEKGSLKTYRGIGLGDKKDDVIYRYGSNQSPYFEDLLTYWKYTSKNYIDKTYTIQFTIKNEIVKQIKIYLMGD